MKIILNYPNYAITESGQVWSKRFYRWLKPWVQNGYKVSPQNISDIVNKQTWKHIYE